jgi:hypothetical protein
MGGPGMRIMPAERVPAERSEMPWNKSFLLLFFKKEVLSCLLAW